MYLISGTHHSCRSEERRVGKEIIPSYKIHMVEEETLGKDPKGGGKEELGEEE